MAKVQGVIPNLVNGVSQQAIALRLPTQCSDSLNYYPTVVDGLTKRPRTNWLARTVASFDANNTFTHMYIRDDNEKYSVFIFDDGSVRVFDFAGNEKTVTNSSTAYLTAGTTPMPQKIKALTIADYTFIINTDMVVAAGSTFSASRNFEALFSVVSGNYSREYDIVINGATIASYSTPDSSDVSHEPYVATDYIASQLYTAATGAASSPWSRGLYGSVVYISNDTADFSCSMLDGFGGRASECCHNVVQFFSNLPTEGPDDFVIKVKGDTTTDSGDYWVQLEEGVWSESCAPGARLGVDATTMPHALTRNDDGTFTFAPLTWTDRVCGDPTTVPDPSFVGQAINDVLFYKNRLGFMTDQNVCFSEAGEFYNFYRTTLTTTLDTDPIDIAASDVKVNLLEAPCILQGELMLFSERTQFLLSGDQNGALTPKSVNCDPLTNYIYTPTVRPVASSANLYFLAEQDGFAQLYEYYLDKARQSAEAQTATSHVPYFIPAGTTRLQTSPDLNLMFITSDASPEKLLVYKYHFSGNDKVQSAWQTWTFPNCTRVVNFVFDKGSLQLLLLRSDGYVHIERMRVEQSVYDPGLPFAVALDQYQQVLGDQWTYDQTTNISTLTLPYTMPYGMFVITDFGGFMPFGVQRIPNNQVRTPLDAPQTTAVLRGDWRGQPVIVGVPYTSYHTLSPFFYAVPTPGNYSGQKTIQTNGRTQIIDFELQYAKTGYFRIEVTPEGRNTRVYSFNAHRLDTQDNKFGVLTVEDGHVSVPILSRNDRVVINIINDSWLPSTFSQGEWRGTFTKSVRSQ